MSKVFIAVPTYENISPDTFKSIYGLDRAGCWCVFDFIRGYDCARARNEIAKQAMRENAEYVLMVDGDVVLPSDALKNLIEWRTDVCLGYYASRNHLNIYDGKTCLFKEGEYDYTQQFTSEEMKEKREAGDYKIQIHGGGLGCSLIRTDVFERMWFPWFKYVTYDNGDVLSEDLYFSEECRKAGIQVYADTRVKCGHIFRRVQWPG